MRYRRHTSTPEQALAVPETIHVTAELDRVTIRLPRRVDARRLSAWVWGLSAALLAGMGALTGLPGGWIAAVVCGVVVGLLAPPVAAWMGRRVHRRRKRGDGSLVAVLLSGGPFVVVCCVVLARVASRNYTGDLDAFSPLLVAIIVSLGAMIPLGVWITEHAGSLTITPAAVLLGRRRWLLEEIASVESAKDGTLRIGGEVAVRLLRQGERAWLRERILAAAAARRASLAAAGHDLSVQGAPPAALEALRGQGETR